MCWIYPYGFFILSFFLYKCFYKKNNMNFSEKVTLIWLDNGINDATVTWNERGLKHEDVISPLQCIETKTGKAQGRPQQKNVKAS